MDLVPTPSQTIGPFFHFALSVNGCLAAAGAQGERVSLACRLLDGDGLPVPDAMIELWQADANGRYNHPEDPQGKTTDPAFWGFGRLSTDEHGACAFETIKPGRVPGWGPAMQAPHMNVSIFARGMLKRLVTRIYFAGDAANAEDALLALVPEERRGTLMAQPRMAQADTAQPGSWTFDIHLCGEGETVFFDV